MKAVRRRSLQRALARRWMVFAAVLSVLLGGNALLLLFLLEDSFIDRHLRAVAAGVVEPGPASPGLPARFQALAWPSVPDDIGARLAGREPGAIAEFRRADGRYVHALAARTASGRPFVLVYDVTNELTVNPRLPGGLAYALAWLALSLLAAWLLARRTGPVDAAALDIADTDNTALAALRQGGRTSLHLVNLATGTATRIGTVGDGRALWGMAIEP